MFRNVAKNASAAFQIKRSQSESIFNPIKIAICGAAGRVGQIVSLFLKQSAYPVELALHDTNYNVQDLAKQLELINVGNKVESFLGPMKTRYAVQDAHIVAILVKARNKPISGDTFENNILSVASIARSCIEVCPDAILAIGTNPVINMVPAINEIYKQNGLSNDGKILGITSVDSMLASVVYADWFNANSTDVFVPVIGGNTIDTAIPLFSQGSPPPKGGFKKEDMENLLTKFFEVKSQANYAEFATGYSIAKFLQSLIRAVYGENEIAECAYISAPKGAPMRYLSTLVELGEDGVRNIYGPPLEIYNYEERIMSNAFAKLENAIDVGEKYAITRRRHEVESAYL